VIVAVLSLLGVVGVTPRPAMSGAVVGGMYLDGEAGDAVVDGKTLIFALGDSTFTPPTATTSELTFTATRIPSCAADCTFTVNVAAPTGGTLAAGTYEDAREVASADHPKLSVYGSSQSCTVINGRFIVDTYTAGPPAKFTIRFEQHCDGDTAALFGGVTFEDSGTPYRARSLSAQALDFGSTRIGTPVTKQLTITNNGPATLFPQTFSLSGPNKAEYAITANTCAAAMAANAPCTVDVKLTPTADGARTAVLTWGDEVSPIATTPGPVTTGTGRDVALSGIGTHSELTVLGDGDFANVRVGLNSKPVDVKLSNTGTEPVKITSATVTGPDASSFTAGNDCDGKELDPTKSCTLTVTAHPKSAGAKAASLAITSDAANGPHAVPLKANGTVGYYLAEANGTVRPYGDAAKLPDASKIGLNAPILNIATTRDGDGYWLVGGDGGIFAYGNAPFWGSTGSLTLNAPVVAMAPTPTDDGYWLVALDGGIFAYGKAPFKESMGGKPLNSPIIGMAGTPTGQGYWLVALDGGIFAFGDAGFFESMGGKPLNSPIVSMARTPSGKGYWLVALDGGVFAFGDAQYYGSMARAGLSAPVIAIAASPTGLGYWLASSDGLVFPFGDAVASGDANSAEIDDVVGLAATAPLLGP
jgi:hypothetical protein